MSAFSYACFNDLETAFITFSGGFGRAGALDAVFPEAPPALLKEFAEAFAILIVVLLWSIYRIEQTKTCKQVLILRGT